MTAKRDYYEVLGVARAATVEDIKKSYRQLALKFHPDKNPGDKSAEDKFKEATEAFQVLTDPEKRRQYDQFGHQAFGPQGPQVDYSNLEDLFSEIFGGRGGVDSVFDVFFGGGRRRAGRGRGAARGTDGADLQIEIALELQDVLDTQHQSIELSRLEPCEDCHGQGGTGKRECGECGGRGQVAYRQGFFSFAASCPRCGGAGTSFKSSCSSCRGEGRRRGKRKISLKIPAGVEDGMRLRLRGEGDAGGGGGERGDLYVVVQVKPHPRFERHGTDLVADVTISYVEAVLGSEIQMKDLSGDTLSIKIPAGTQHGSLHRLRHKGLPSVDHGTRGDLLARINVEIPKTVSAREKQLLQEIAELHATGKGFFNKVKDAFL